VGSSLLFDRKELAFIRNAHARAVRCRALWDCKARELAQYFIGVWGWGSVMRRTALLTSTMKNAVNFSDFSRLPKNVKQDQIAN
jgi:hypothetical protein